MTTPSAAGQRPLCLPPVYEGGQRLHPLPAPRVFWLEPLLRQHELCWRSPRRSGELRIALVGNSAIFGFPLPVEETFGALLNQQFAARDIPAHVFNLAFVNSYQLKDMVIIHEALRYDPDFIVYPMTLEEFDHNAPVMFPSVARFFDSNRATLSTLVAHPPPGLEDLVERYRSFLESHRPQQGRLARIQEGGAFLRAAVQLHAQWVAQHLGAVWPFQSIGTAGRNTTYDCKQTQATSGMRFQSWQSWNALAYLEQIRDIRGVEVLIVNWPVAHEPVGDCYNVRYPAEILAEYSTWLREEAAARGFRYVDLHELLPAEDFLDSLHVGAAGHRQIADRLGTILGPWLTDAFARRARPSSEPPSAAAR